MPRSKAMRTSQQAAFPMFFHHCSRNNTRWNRNDRIPDQHHTSRDKTSDRSNRGNISIADRSHRNNRPINTIGNVIELGIRLCPLDHEHDRSDRSNQDQDKKEEYEYLPAAQPQGYQQ